MVDGDNQLFWVRCKRKSSGQIPDNIISVACHLEEVCHPSVVQLGKPFQAPETICNLYVLLSGAGGVVVCQTSLH